ncbi:MAG: hypothetical protein JXB03_12520 [Spirochaetales bacterium]|nr:hypothetical protein [Spirochaetales bacterium]
MPFKRCVLLPVFFCFINVSFFGAPVDDYLTFLSIEDKTQLLEKQELVVYGEGTPVFNLLPDTALSDKIRQEFDEFDANVNDEALFLLPLMNQENSIDHIYRKLRNVNTLSGIQYHSNHYREWKILFDNVFEAEKVGSDTALEFSSKGTVPHEERIIIHLEDVNFGSSYYEAVYFNSDSAAGFGLKNLTSLRYKLIPLIGKGKVRFQMLMIPTDEYLLVYGVVGVKAGSLIQEVIHLPSSFYTRLKALRNWFSAQIYQ